MPWFGMHVLDRIRNQAVEAQRSEASPDHGTEESTSVATLISQAGPTLTVVILWALVGALVYCGASGISQWDIIFTAISGPLLMAVVGAAWGSYRSRASSGLDAAIVTGVVIGAGFVIAAIA